MSYRRAFILMDNDTIQLIGHILAIGIALFPVALWIRRKRVAAGIDPATGNQQSTLLIGLVFRAVPLVICGVVLLFYSENNAKPDMQGYGILISVLFILAGLWLGWRFIRSFRRLSQQAYARKKQTTSIL